jgi:hypothetical protein
LRDFGPVFCLVEFLSRQLIGEVSGPTSFLFLEAEVI